MGSGVGGMTAGGGGGCALDMSSSVQILVSAKSFSYILVSAESDAIHSAANRSENSGFVQNSDQLLQMVRKWSEN